MKRRLLRRTQSGINERAIEFKLSRVTRDAFGGGRATQLCFRIAQIPSFIQMSAVVFPSLIEPKRMTHR